MVKLVSSKRSTRLGSSPKWKWVMVGAVALVIGVRRTTTLRSMIFVLVESEKYFSPVFSSLDEPSSTTSLAGNTTTNKTFDLEDIRTRCFPHNSDAWLTGDRYSNQDYGMGDEWIDHAIRGPLSRSKMPFLWDNTFCHRNSPVRTFSGNSTTTTTAEDWYHRFFFLALHWQFHQPAMPEYETRQQNCEREELRAFREKYKLGRFDFECSDAKYLVSRFGNVGFGAIMMLQIQTTILIAMRTNRIPIFMNFGRPQGWRMAPQDCPNKDFQCYFLPLSPCSPRLDDIHNAVRYGANGGQDNRTEQMYLRRNINLPDHLTEKRIVLIDSGLSAASTHHAFPFGEHVQSVVQKLIDHYRKTDPTGFDWEILEQAKEWLVTKKDEDNPTYGGAFRQIFLYVLRLNAKYEKRVQKSLAPLLSYDDDNDNWLSSAVGLPIRGSDKCARESTCHSFSKHMELSLLDRNHQSSTTLGRRPRLILTTEDPEIFKASQIYQQNISFPYEFLTNPQDNLQGSGFPRKFQSGNIAVGDVGEATMLSTFIAWRLHLSAGKRVFLNCCSNSHMILESFLSGQCGVRRHGNSVFEASSSSPPLSICLNDASAIQGDNIPNRYQLCCAWKQDAFCKAEFPRYKKAFFEERKRIKEQKLQGQEQLSQNLTVF